MFLNNPIMGVGRKKILGQFSDYEVQTTFWWKVELQAFTKWLLGLMVILLLSFSLSHVYVQNQIKELKKLQTDIRSEIQILKDIKEDLNFPVQIPIYLEDHVQTKRDISRRGKNSNIAKNTKAVTAAHLERTVSYVNSGSHGIIASWSLQNWSESSFTLENFSLEDRNASLVVPETGLYLIYAQLCYPAVKENNSFEVRLMNKGKSHMESKIIAQCSSGTSSSGNDITCFTSIVQVLRSGDKLYLQQVQKERAILMDKGRSFMGVIKLSN